MFLLRWADGLGYQDVGGNRRDRRISLILDWLRGLVDDADEIRDEEVRLPQAARLRSMASIHPPAIEEVSRRDGERKRDSCRQSIWKRLMNAPTSIPTLRTQLRRSVRRVVPTAFFATASVHAGILNFTGDFDFGEPLAVYRNAAAAGPHGVWTAANLNAPVGYLAKNDRVDPGTGGLIPHGYLNFGYDNALVSDLFTFTAVAPSAGTVSFDWFVSGFSESYMGIVTGGTHLTLFPALAGTWPALQVQQGEVFGFYVEGVRREGFEPVVASLTITGFNFTAIPEPSTWATLTASTLLGAAILRKRRLGRHRA